MLEFGEFDWCSLNLFHNPVNFVILFLNFNCLQTARWNPLLGFISELKFEPYWVVSLNQPTLFLYYKIIGILICFETIQHCYQITNSKLKVSPSWTSKQGFLHLDLATITFPYLCLIHTQKSIQFNSLKKETSTLHSIVPRGGGVQRCWSLKGVWFWKETLSLLVLNHCWWKMSCYIS